MIEMIVDTGPLVALFNANDQHRAWCCHVFDSVKARLLTTEPVLSEVFFHLGKFRCSREPFSRMIHSSAITVIPTPDVRAACAFAVKYSGDFADASLVSLSESFPAARIFTVDFKDFTRYRRFRDQPIPLVEKTKPS